MIKVMFDELQLNSDYVYELSREYKLFGDNFELGCTPAQRYTLVVDKLAVEGNPNPTTVKIIESSYADTTLATLHVDDIEETDELTVKYTLVDAMVNLNFNYDASPLMPADENGQYPTLLDIVDDICSQAGIALNANSRTFYGYDKVIKWYDSTISARDYISFVAELNAGYALINTEGELIFVAFVHPSSADEIPAEDCENFVLGERYEITRVVYDNSSGTKWVYGDDSGATVYLNINNGFIEAETDVSHIYNAISYFQFYNLSVDNCPIVDAWVGDLITFNANSNDYMTICQFEQSYAGDSWFGGYKLDIASPKQAETTVKDNTAQQIKNIYSLIDRNLGLIQTTISNLRTDLSGEISGASSTWSQTANGFTAAINTINKTLGKYAKYFDFTDHGLYISDSESNIKARYDSNGLAFIDASGGGEVELAWLNTRDGLGAPKITIGANSTQQNRWQWIESSDGYHSRFTRHK